MEVYTPTVPVQRTFGEKLADAFSDGWKGFVSFLSAVGCCGLSSSLPALVILAVVIVVVIVLHAAQAPAEKSGRKRQEAE